MDGNGVGTQLTSVNCEDFGTFQSMLKSKRQIDDTIVYLLNTSIPTNSFAGQVDAKEQCRSLYDQISKSYDERNQAIKTCIDLVRSTAGRLQTEKTRLPDDLNTTRKLRSEQTKLRLMQSELNVEEVLKERITKVFNDRCKFFYQPSR